MARKSSEIIFKDFLIDKSNQPIYYQLYHSIRSAILSGRLRPGDKLSSTREISKYLGISRTTVIHSFELLVSEGYVVGITGSGSFVNEQLPESFINANISKTNVITGKSKTLDLSRSGLNIFKSRYINLNPQGVIPFLPGIPSFTEFPYDTWARLAAKSVKELRSIDMNYADSRGLRTLRELIAVYLRHSRGVICDSEQVIIVSGAQQSINLIGNIFLNPGDDIIMEDPVFFGADVAFRVMGAKINYIPVNEEGIDIKKIVKSKLIPKLIYVTPSHQYPLGYTMSLKRRMQLLEWAAEYSVVIIEDDYDSEFRYTGNPLSSLQGMDAGKCVIYVGTFSKVLFPSIRIGYIVLPENLIEIFMKAKSIFDRNSPILEQLIISKFMHEGHFGRYLRKMRLIYQARKELLETEFNQKFSAVGNIKASQAGLHAVAHISHEINDKLIQTEAAKENLIVTSLSSSCKKRKDLNGLVLGYSAFKPNEIIAGLDKLGKVIDKINKK